MFTLDADVLLTILIGCVAIIGFLCLERLWRMCGLLEDFFQEQDANGTIKSSDTSSNT